MPNRRRTQDSDDAPQAPKTAEDARTLAINRLSVREYSAGEMRQYLRRKGFNDEVASQIASELSEQGLINDRRYARAVTRTQAIRDKGPGYILMKLRQKGVRIELGEVRDLYADAADQPEIESARRIVERRYPRAQSDPKEKQRAFQALLRRGFSSEVARKVLLHDAAPAEDAEGSSPWPQGDG